MLNKEINTELILIKTKEKKTLRKSGRSQKKTKKTHTHTDNKNIIDL